MGVDIEEIIAKAKAEGAFDGLPGRGKPLDLRDDPFGPVELRMTLKILRDNNVLPPEVQASKKVGRLREALAASREPRERERLTRALRQAEVAFAASIEAMKRRLES